MLDDRLGLDSTSSRTLVSVLRDTYLLSSSSATVVYPGTWPLFHVEALSLLNLLVSCDGNEEFKDIDVLYKHFHIYYGYCVVRFLNDHTSLEVGSRSALNHKYGYDYGCYPMS